MGKDGPKEPVVDKASQRLPVQRAAFRWPWGIVALLVMALAWLGIYLLWNGVVFLFQL